MKKIPVWTIERRAVRGIELQGGQIVLGEEGRGRRYVRVPLPKGAVVEGNRLMAVPSDNEFTALVLIRDHSGFRGGWRLAEYAEAPCPRQGESFTWDSPCPDCGRLVVHQLLPAGDVQPEALGRVIAEGRCAQGDAGRMGGGPEYLLLLRPGARFSIRRHGRLYGAPAVLNVSVSPDGEVRVVDARTEIDAVKTSRLWGEVRT